MKMAMYLFVIALIGCSSAAATERQILSCDTTTGFGTNGGVAPSTAPTHVEGSGAVRVTVTGTGYTFKALAAGDQGSFWNSYNGIALRVRGQSGAQWGVIDIWYDSSAYFHYYATFPIDPGVWTDVVIPWNEFTQRNFAGPIENHRAEVFGISFRNVLAHDEAAPLGVAPAQIYDVDDIRLVDGISVTTPTNGTGDLRNTVAKMVAQQPVTIIVMGASITWGLKLQPNQQTNRWSSQLETLLRNHYGYSNINIINTAVGGHNSWEGAISLGYDVYSHGNIDLVIVGDYYYNDYDDAIGQGGPPEVADNFGRVFDLLLSHGFYSKAFPAHETLFCNGGLHAEPGNLNRNDTYLAAVETEVAARNIPTANYYYPLQALGEPYLSTNYYVYSGDYAHPNTAGHTYIADKIYNAIISAGGPVGNPVSVSASSVSFSAPEGSVTPVTRTITLHNTSGGSITVTPSN
ncbi:MAG TPA: CIA30 family protein, partial [Planctomycetota bacterium]|nr:CIA30 family protein [Planctomycetota bacterium]